LAQDGEVFLAPAPVADSGAVGGGLSRGEGAGRGVSERGLGIECGTRKIAEIAAHGGAAKAGGELAGCEGKGAGPGFFGPPRLAERAQGLAKVRLGIGHARVAGEGPGDLAGGIGRITALERDDA